MTWRFGRSRPAIRFGRLDPSHAEACATLHAGSFAQGWSTLEFERLIAAQTSWAEAAVEARSGALIGFVLSRGAAGEAEILTFAVDAPWRRRGVGRQLLERHLAALGRTGIGALFLEVAEDNRAARALYAAAGFAEVGRRPAYYGGRAGAPGAAALVLRRELP